jgi:predicted RNase H-like nuclease (RuvC/YqgF family)
VKELHIKVERLTNERNEALEKYQESENLWRGKYAKQMNENKSLYEMNESLKEDNNALITQLDKFTKRIKQLEGDMIREQESQKTKDHVIADLNKQLQTWF